MESPAEYWQRRRDVIAENITRRLAELGVSQNQLARMLNVQHRHVWDWVHARHAPSERYVRRIEKVLDLPAGYLTADHGQESAA